MHTVISAFDDAAQAQRSVDRLVELGVRRGDIHIEHKGLHTSSALAAFGAFFVSLLGQQQPSAAEQYTRAVQGGQHVLVLDALDEEQAGRASALLAAMGGEGPSTIHRPLLRPLRDIVAVRAVLADQAERRNVRNEERPTIRAEQNERAFAFGGERRPQKQPDPDDANHAPGLRYADQDSKDKPRR
jgi:hypothetical protein